MCEMTSKQVRRPYIAVMPKYVTADRLPHEVSSCDSLLIADNYLQAIVRAGGVPLVLPITGDAETYDALFALADGFLLTGGTDLSPSLYGGDVSNELLDVRESVREDVELSLLDYAFQHDVPVLGICRGIQLLNVYKGGTLYEDLVQGLPEVDEDGSPVVHWQSFDYSKPSHTVKLVEGGLLNELLGVDEVITNSMHHQGVRKLADSLEALAYGPGGLVEALRAPELSFALGLQWHPEYLGEHQDMNRIFEAFVGHAAAYRERCACAGA